MSTPAISNVALARAACLPTQTTANLSSILPPALKAISRVALVFTAIGIAATYIAIVLFSAGVHLYGGIALAGAISSFALAYLKSHSASPRTPASPTLRLPRVPPPDFIYNSSALPLVVYRAGLEQRPEKFLEHIASHGFPTSVSFTGEEGTDGGGLSKEFNRILCEKLAEKGLFHLTEEGFPSIENEQEKIFFRNWGKLLSALRGKNHGRSDVLLTGRLFSDAFFEVLKVLTSQEQEVKKKKQALLIYGKNSALGKTTYKPLLTYLEKNYPTREDSVAIQSNLQDLGLIEEQLLTPPPEGQQNAPPSAEEIQAIRAACLEPFKEMYTKCYSAAEVMFEGLDPTFRAILATSDPLEISKKIQGEAISSAELAGSLHLRTTDPIVLQKVEWLTERILDEPPGSQWVKKLVVAVTGQGCMGANFGINVYENSEAETIRASSCFNNIYISKTHRAAFIDNPALTDKERFFAVLELLLNHRVQDAF